MTLQTLIDKQDTAEIVRDQVAALLALETAAQVALATTAGKPDPSLWAFRIFQERSNPWEVFPGKKDDTTPIVNVWWDSSTFEMAASNVVDQQKADITLNVDCYGYGRSSANGPGHTPGDQAAAEAVQRAVRFCRNVIMAGPYTYLGLRGTVWRRWIQSITIMQPQQDNQQVEHVVGARIALRIEASEFSPQYVPGPLELLTARVERSEDNQVLATAEYDYT